MIFCHLTTSIKHLKVSLVQEVGLERTLSLQVKHKRIGINHSSFLVQK